MTRLNWKMAGSRQFEAGVNRGVLYVGNNPGVPWIGLISVKESHSGATVKPRYLDGIKITNGQSPDEFEGVIEAYTYPPEFEVCDGTKVITNGLRVKHQRRKSFGLSYQTRIGNEIKGLDLGYKIHILYNVLAEPSDKLSKTLNDENETFNFSWNISTRAPLVEDILPSAHFVIDSREVPQILLTQIEDILYGNEEQEARLPSAGELVFLFDSFEDLVYDAGDPYDPVYVTYDAGAPGDPIIQTIDGGAL